MKLPLAQLLSLLVSLVSAAPASTPQAYLVAYETLLCAGASTPVNATSDRIIEFKQQTCTIIDPPILSFEAGLDYPCPGDKSPVVLVFPNQDCTGEPTDAGNLPANLSPGQCLNVVGADTVPPTVGGQSTIFLCGPPK